MAQMGWLALPFAEAQGGLGGGPLSIALMMEELGKGLVLEPVLPTLLLFGGTLKTSPAIADAWLPQLIEGRLQGALAITERHSRYQLADVQCTLQRVGDGHVLDGEKVLVLNGAAADRLVVVARSSGGRFDAHGISLVLVSATAPGVSRTPLRLMDGQRVANIRFDKVAVASNQLLCVEGDGHALLKQVVQDATLALCAEGLGVMQLLYATTLEYVKTRKQFGVPIGKFQALQHDAVNMMVALEQARSMAMFAAMSVNASPAERAQAMSAVKVQINRSAREVGQLAIQLHGGIGMTMEYKGGHYFKRLTVIENLFGDTDYHLARLARGDGLLADMQGDAA
jgi:alkylation response protein AidB-like acyl-CoA dehydrogenase